MSRRKALFRMVARMCAVSAALTVASYTVFYGLLMPRLFPEHAVSSIGILLRSLMVDIAWESAVTGLALGLPMALLTAIFFRQIRRPTFYRFAMLTSSLIVVILFLSEGAFSFNFLPLTQFLLYLEYNASLAALSLVVAVKFGLAAWMSQVVAGKYMRDIRTA